MVLSEIIRNIEFFAGLDQKTLRRIEQSAIVCQFGPDEVIIKEGELGLGMYVVISGKVEVLKKIPGGKLKLAELGPSQFFAEMSLIDDKPRSATVATLEATECLLLTRDSLLKLMDRSPQIALRMAKMLAARLRVAGEKQASVPPKPVLPPEAAATNGNGHHAPDPADDICPRPGSAKAAIQDQLVGAFSAVYALKAMTRFSVAVLGCPVEGFAANAIDEIRLGDVKVFILPAGESVHLAISAWAEGNFNLHVFHPQSVTPLRFGPVPIAESDSFTLNLPAAGAEAPIELRRLN
ncbi:MAG: hypothetical protein JWN34_5214 [Bryobacterales bacterium]|jgi:hypothetical protein|nr:hypothetical protein [Bryobacterales bacterium]